MARNPQQFVATANDIGGDFSREVLRHTFILDRFSSVFAYHYLSEQPSAKHAAVLLRYILSALMPMLVSPFLGWFELREQEEESSEQLSLAHVKDNKYRHHAGVFIGLGCRLLFAISIKTQTI